MGRALLDSNSDLSKNNIATVEFNDAHKISKITFRENLCQQTQIPSAYELKDSTVLLQNSILLSKEDRGGNLNLFDKNCIQLIVYIFIYGLF